VASFLGRSLSCKLKGLLLQLSSARLSVCHGCTVAKWCKIGLRFLLITNMKSHTGFQITYQPLTLGWPWRPPCTVAAKQCEIWPRLLLITNRKWHTPFQMTIIDLGWPSRSVTTSTVSSTLAIAGLFVWYMCSNSGNSSSSNTVVMVVVIVIVVVIGDGHRDGRRRSAASNLLPQASCCFAPNWRWQQYSASV